MMEGGLTRHLLPLAIGLAPAVAVALLWSPNSDWTPTKYLIRGYNLPFIGIELFVTIVAFREGMARSLVQWNWHRPALVAMIALIGIALVTAVFAPLINVAAVLTFYWLVHALFALAVAFLCGRLFLAEDLTLAYMVGFAIFCIQFLLFVSLIPDWETFDWRLGFMIFSHTRHAGYYFAAMGALGIGGMAGSRGKLGWTFAMVIATLAVCLALWTGSRGAAVAIVGAWAIGLLIARPMRAFRGWGGGLAAMAVAVGIVLLAPAVDHPLMGISRTVTATAQPDVSTGRTTIWRGVIGAIQRRPIFGYGEGQMSKVAPYATMVQPHQSILQVTLAWGLLGLACTTVIVFAFLRRALGLIRLDDGTLTPLAMSMAAIGLLSLYDGALYYPLSTSIFLACGAAIVAWSPKQELAAAQTRT